MTVSSGRGRIPKSYVSTVIPRNRVIRIAPSHVRTTRAFWASGRLNAGTPSETASTPVSAVQPEENARRIRKSPTPSSPGGCCGYGASGMKSKIAPSPPYTRSTPRLPMKRYVGAATRLPDSRMPRRLATATTTTAATQSDRRYRNTTDPAVVLPRRSCRCCAVGSGVPTKSRFRRCRRTGSIVRRPAPQTKKPHSERWLSIEAREVLESRVLGEKRDLDLAGGAIPLLPDVHLGGLFRWVLRVQRRPMEEHDDVGVLLKGAGFPEIREPRCIIASGFDRPG